MSDCFIGEIRMFAGSYAPQDWLLCDGSTLNIASYSTLFSLIGTAYGGDGITNFKLPDLRGRIPIHMGQGTGLTSRIIGQSFGAETVTLSTSNLPAHTHTIKAGGTADTTAATGNYLADAAGYSRYATSASTGSSMDATELSSEAGSAASQSFTNVMPSLGVNFIIAYEGIFPTRG